MASGTALSLILARSDNLAESQLALFWLNELALIIPAIAGRPRQVNIVATGRAAPPALIDLADTVTEMVKVKHAFDRGIRARRGIDF